MVKFYFVGKKDELPSLLVRIYVCICVPVRVRNRQKNKQNRTRHNETNNM